MVDRMTCIYGDGLLLEESGDLVRHTDYAALERRCEALEEALRFYTCADLEDAGDAVQRWEDDGYGEKARLALTPAPPREAEAFVQRKERKFEEGKLKCAEMDSYSTCPDCGSPRQVLAVVEGRQMLAPCLVCQEGDDD